MEHEEHAGISNFYTSLRVGAGSRVRTCPRDEGSIGTAMVLGFSPQKDTHSSSCFLSKKSISIGAFIPGFHFFYTQVGIATALIGGGYIFMAGYRID